MRLTVSALIVSLPFVFSSPGQSPGGTNQVSEDNCIALLSGFPKEGALAGAPPRPNDADLVTLTYFASGCYGNCPAFTLSISKGIAQFDGHAYVRAKGKRTAKLSQKQFQAFLDSWYDGKFYAMRDNYCDIHCPNGTQIVVTDIPESSITLTAPSITKRVYECFSTLNNQPRTPKPPEQYFKLTRQFWALAKAKRWL